MDLKTNIEKRLGTTIAGADDKALYYALLGLTKELCSEKKPNEGDRKVYYISAEFLIGKLLSNNLINLGVIRDRHWTELSLWIVPAEICGSQTAGRKKSVDRKGKLAYKDRITFSCTV